MKTMFGPFDLRGGKIKLKSFGIAVNEIEDAMPAGIHAGDQIGPRHGALWRNARRQTAERTLSGEPGEVGHLAFRHELRQQIGVEAVHSKNNHLFGAHRSATGVLAREKETQPRGTRPEQADRKSTRLNS